MASSRIGDGAEGIESLYKNSKYSDLTLKLGDREFKVHRAVICTQSRHLDAACNRPWKEGKDRMVQLHDDDPEAMELMLEFMYTGDTTQDYRARDAKLEQEGVFWPQQDLDLYLLADKYDVPSLRKRVGNHLWCDLVDWNVSGRDCLRVVQYLADKTGDVSAGVIRDMLESNYGKIVKALEFSEDCRGRLAETPGLAVKLVLAGESHLRTRCFDKKIDYEDLRGYAVQDTRGRVNWRPELP